MAYSLGQRYYVVCKSMSEFITYRNKKIKELDSNKRHYRILDFVFVDSPVKLRGCKDIHGVFYGNWKENPNIKHILETIHISHASSSVHWRLPDDILQFYYKELVK